MIGRRKGNNETEKGVKEMRGETRKRNKRVEKK